MNHTRTAKKAHDKDAHGQDWTRKINWPAQRDASRALALRDAEEDGTLGP
jgi:hypothetical protein